MYSQYAPIYRNRFNAIRVRFNLKVDFWIGTLIKVHTRLPAIIREDVMGFNQVHFDPMPDTMVDPLDKLYLELLDGTRYQLINVQIDKLISGVIVGIKGKIVDHITISVGDIICPYYAPQHPIERIPAAGWAILVSSLYNPEQRLVRWFESMLTNPNNRIAHLIIVGDTKGNSLAQEMQTIREIARETTCPISVIPGKNGTTLAWPQRPFSPVFFKPRDGVEFHPNPYARDIQNLLFMGENGQSVRDITRTTTLTDPEALGAIMKFGIIAPTAPSTLPMIVKEGAADDPFVMKSCPHVLFSGNATTPWTDMHKIGYVETRMILLPRFSEDGGFASVNLDTLDTVFIKAQADKRPLGEGEGEEEEIVYGPDNPYTDEDLRRDRAKAMGIAYNENAKPKISD